MNHVEYGPIAEPFEYYPEISHLRSGNLAESASIANRSVPYSELSRTRATLYTQGYIHGGNELCWELLTGAQNEETRLTLKTFDELNELSHQAMPNAESYLAVELGNTIHDAFKNLDLIPVVGLSRDDNHDEALQRLFRPEYREVRRQHFSSLELCTERQLNLVEGMLKGNFIRFVQSQSSEAEINTLASLPRNQLLCAIMHGIHDLGGAMGDKNETTSLTLDEPAAVRLLDAAGALLATPAELGLPDDTPITPNERHDLYKYLRAARLDIPLDLTEAVSERHAKLTVADLLRCYSAEDFAKPQAAFNRLPSALRTAWASIHAIPIQYPNADRIEAMGTEYATAFLRAFGKQEDDLYLALGCLAQIQLHANSLPNEMGAAWPTDAPYQKINFYHLAQAFKEAPPNLAEPIPIAYTISDGVLIPKLATSGEHAGHERKLIHPDKYIPEGYDQ